MSRNIIVVTGLPASGKTTLAHSLAGQLSLPHLDKDDFLEELFATEGCSNLERRSVLSREADLLFEAAAKGYDAVVLSSWWRHPRASEASGTSTSWLVRSGVALYEVHCQCPAKVAFARFRNRQRHPGHADADRDPEQLLQQFEEAALLGPLFPRQALVFSTAEPVSQRAMEALAQEVRKNAAASVA